jgi:hypothetical protein
MNKKVISVALCALLYALCFYVEAQQPAKIPRIGYVSPIPIKNSRADKKVCTVKPADPHEHCV